MYYTNMSERFKQEIEKGRKRIAKEKKQTRSLIKGLEKRELPTPREGQEAPSYPIQGALQMDPDLQDIALTEELLPTPKKI